MGRDLGDGGNTDILPDVTTRMNSLRRLCTLVAAGIWLGAASLVLAGPAAADTPETWSDFEIDKLEAVLLLAGVPLLAFVVITFLVYVPSIIRGERIAPGHPGTENQWLGGPRRSADELAAPDTEDSQAGGASGRW